MYSVSTAKPEILVEWCVVGLGMLPALELFLYSDKVLKNAVARSTGKDVRMQRELDRVGKMLEEVRNFLLSYLLLSN